MKTLFSLCFLALIFCGCASLTSEGERVKLSQNKEDSKDCLFIKQVQAHPPYGLPRDWKYKLRNEAARVGANLVFVKSTPVFGSVSGEAYKCGN